MAKINIKENFFVHEDKKNYKCGIEGCKSKLTGVDSTLKRHIAQLHSNIADQIGLKGYAKSKKE